jgi:hypothetical protein
MLSTTNSAFQELVGKTIDLSYDMVAYMQFDTGDVSFDFRHGCARTSRIMNIQIDEVSRSCFDITITTRNSIYVFRKGTFSDVPVFTELEELQIQLAMGVF